MPRTRLYRIALAITLSILGVAFADTGSARTAKAQLIPPVEYTRSDRTPSPRASRSFERDLLEPSSTSTTSTVPPTTTSTTVRHAPTTTSTTVRRTTSTTGPTVVSEAPSGPGGDTAVASWYAVSPGEGACAAKCSHMSPTFAHKTMAFGTAVRFCYDGRCVVAYCTDRGPYVAGRTFDLSTQTAAAINPAYRSNGVFSVAWSYA